MKSNITTKSEQRGRPHTLIQPKCNAHSATIHPFLQLQTAVGNQGVLRHMKAPPPGSFHNGNRTGLPAQLRMGLEQLSGLDLSNIHVHYNSPKPAQLHALAYTQGRDIHVGPGQEEHLPHEGWHAVQQMQGRVEPTTQAKGVEINDDKDLEEEADVMGKKAVQMVQVLHGQEASQSPFQYTHANARTSQLQESNEQEEVGLDPVLSELIGLRNLMGNILLFPAQAYQLEIDRVRPLLNSNLGRIAANFGIAWDRHKQILEEGRADAEFQNLVTGVVVGACASVVVALGVGAIAPAAAGAKFLTGTWWVVQGEAPPHLQHLEQLLAVGCLHLRSLSNKFRVN